MINGFWDTRHAAAHLGISQVAVRALAARGRLPYVRIGGRMLLREAGVRALGSSSEYQAATRRRVSLEWLEAQGQGRLIDQNEED